MQAQPPAGTQIFAVTGSMNAAGVTSITDSKTGNSDSFSLQLNANNFVGPACTGSCTGAWQQFVYHNSSNQAYIEYWLFGISNCPNSSWNYNSGPGTPGCYLNSPAASGVPDITTSLSETEFAGFIDGATDYVTIAVAGEMWQTNYPDTLGLGDTGNWISAQFNVFGTGNCSEAIFNSGSVLNTFVSVETTDAGGLKAASACRGGSPTCESNNLSLQPVGALGANSSAESFSGAPGCCPVSTSDVNGIWFLESYDPTGFPIPGFCLLNSMTPIWAAEGL
jgi:hypothetical protein